MKTSEKYQENKWWSSLLSKLESVICFDICTNFSMEGLTWTKDEYKLLQNLFSGNHSRLTGKGFSFEKETGLKLNKWIDTFCAFERPLTSV